MAAMLSRHVKIALMHMLLNFVGVVLVMKLTLAQQE